MTGSSLPPNPLADLYDSLYIMLEALPAETHPAWELAIESILFGGEGITSETISYGEQQAKKNDFRMSAYRTQYGDGEHVTEFPTLQTKPPSAKDRQYIDEEIQLPVSPESGTVLPLFVDDDTLPEAARLLNEFPTEPDNETDESNNSDLLNPNLFPGLTASTSNQTASQNGLDTGQSSAHQTETQPNELADLYDGLYTLLESLPDHTNPRWQEAIESILFGGAYLGSEASPYGEQQAERNDFSMPDYRSKYGDGSRVTEFPAIATKQPRGDDAQYVDEGVELPLAPDTLTALPLAPTEEALPEAARLLKEFPVAPDAEVTKRDDGDALFDLDAFLADIDSHGQINATDSQSKLESDPVETDGNNLKSHGASSSAGSDLSQQERERLADIIDLAPTSNGELASSWNLETTTEAWEYLSQHLDEYYTRNENNRIEPTEEAIQIDSSSKSVLSQQERERLADIVELAPTSNGELASSWDIDTTKEVWEYLTQHLDEYYYRNENERIEPTKEAIQIGTQTDVKDSSTDSKPDWVPDSNHDNSSSHTGTESPTDDRNESASTTETEAESKDNHSESRSGSSSSKLGLSEQDRERLADIIDLAPTSNGELASSWDLDTTKEVWEYLTQHLDKYYTRNENNRIEPTEEAIEIDTPTEVKDSSADSSSEPEANSDQDGSSSGTDTETHDEQNRSTSTTETREDTDGDTPESPSVDSTVLRQESAGESTVPLDQESESDSETSRKYDDPEAERAHRRAQQRDPSDVVELGEEIKLTIKQVDYSSRPPTIMGTKNRLVVFVIDAPQDLSEYETIKAKVVDYGGKNNSAEAAFSGYVD
jgi:hypothetical protein